MATVNYILGFIGFALVVFGFEMTTEFKIPAIVTGVVVIGYAFKRMLAYNKNRIYGEKEQPIIPPEEN